MAKKAPRRTAERILDISLDLFNRFGEPNFSTTLISAEMRISPGNLYYHYPAKDDLINRLFDRYAEHLEKILVTVSSVCDVAAAWRFVHSLFELVWQYRFFYRDLNDLLSKNRRIEMHFQSVLKIKTRAFEAMLNSLRKAGALTINQPSAQTTTTTMVVLLSYWLNFEYVRNPRQALEPQHSQAALQRGTEQLLNLLHSYFSKTQSARLENMIAAHQKSQSEAQNFALQLELSD